MSGLQICLMLIGWFLPLTAVAGLVLFAGRRQRQRDAAFEREFEELVVWARQRGWIAAPGSSSGR